MYTGKLSLMIKMKNSPVSEVDSSSVKEVEKKQINSLGEHGTPALVHFKRSSLDFVKTFIDK